MDKAELLEQVCRELLSVLFLLLLEGRMPADTEWQGWRTLSDANGILDELGLPKVERPEGYR